MNPELAGLAKKYATAFLDVAGAEFDEQELHRVVRVQEFLSRAREILFFFNLPLIEPAVGQRVMDMLFKDFKTQHLMTKLMKLLCKQRRALLIPPVLNAVAALYRERTKSVAFVVTSSQELSGDDKKVIENFLREGTQKKVDLEYGVDKALIAGVRVQNDTLLWEYSVRKQLMMMRRSLIEQGAQWN